MKKIIILIFFLLVYFLPINSANAQVNQSTCVWRSYPNNECFKEEERKDSGNCSSADRPEGKKTAGGINSEVVNAGCCCKIANYTPPTPTPPKFIMPELQISIPGLKLTPTTSIKYFENSDGSVFYQFPWLSEYILAIFNYGLSVAGILAAIVLMAGGVLWLVSSGDASKITQAKELIIGSITGLVILSSSYIILTQINPSLTQFSSIGVGTIKATDLEPFSDDGNPDRKTDCNNCVSIQGIPVKNGNLVNSSVYDKLKTALANSGSISWRITEAYPPSQTHNSTCHYNGNCVDVAITSDNSCTNVQKLITIMQNAGLTVFNEYTSCNGKKTTYSTGGHLHIK